MENTIFNKMFTKGAKKKNMKKTKVSNLSKAEMNQPYVIKGIDTRDDEIKNFLFTLGCYEGESVTIISKLAENYVIAIKDARYSIDTDLAKAILI